MSSHLPSRWLFAAALLAGGVPTSAAVAQSPEPLNDPPARLAPQTAPVPLPIQIVPTRLYVEPLLLEEEQVSEHGDRPHVASPIMPAPRVLRACGLPECDPDDDKMAPEEMTLRCLLFSINPLAAFLPLRLEGHAETLPSPNYMQNTGPVLGALGTSGKITMASPTDMPPPAIAPTSADLQVSARDVLELVVKPREVECLEVMPTEVEQLDVMPVEEESEPEYQLLAPWTDYTRWFKNPTWPLAELKVSVNETETGSLLFGVGAEVGLSGTITVTTEPLSETPPPPMPKGEKAAEVVPAAPPQVQLNMLVAEVKGKAARRLHLVRPTDDKKPHWMIEVADEARQKSLDASLNGLSEKGQATVLTAPQMRTVSGQQVSFLTGGQRAFRVVTELGQVGGGFEEFGTRVTCSPRVMADGTIHLDVEAQRVTTMTDVPPGHTLVLSGPEAGGNARLVIFVTPKVVETPATDAAPTEIPQPVFDFSQAVRGCLDFFGLSGRLGAGPSDSQRRIILLMNQSENLRKIDAEMERFWMVNQPSHLTPERVNIATNNDEESVHDLLVKCQRELSRSHYASAEDLAQKAINRDRKQVAADPLVLESNLLQRVKAIASLPLGTVDPCAAKGAGDGILPAGAAKAIGSAERIVEALMEEFNAAYLQGKYRDAEVLAENARKLDPDNAAAVAALKMAAIQMSLPQHSALAGRTVAALTVQSRNDFKAGRYEEARNAAMQALSVAPGEPMALAMMRQTAEAMAKQPRPESVPQCTYVGTNVRPILPSVDPAVVGALQKILIEGDKGGSFGGVEEAEPKDDNSKPMPRR
jgi:tetratricopeptide (TPR) repeat protein